MSIQIKGTGSYVPDRILTNADLEKIVETSDEWIRTRTGIEERHIAAKHQATSDLAYEACLRALDMAQVKAEDVGIIIVATVTADHAFPSTGCILQHRLGARNAMAFDLEAACTGLLYSLETANALMLTNKKYRYALVIGAEKLSSIVNWEERNTCVLFGDGAAAVLLENVDDGKNESCILASDLHADGAYTAILNLPAGGSREPASAETVANKRHSICMEGKDVFKLAVGGMVSSSNIVLAEAGVDSHALKLVIPHQANMRIIDAVAKRLDVTDAQVYTNVNRYGNTSAASIGICLDEVVRGGQISRGDYVLLTAFGGGLTWGALVFRF